MCPTTIAVLCASASCTQLFPEIYEPKQWIPTFCMPILDVLDPQQQVMIKIMNTIQAIFLVFA